MRCPCRFRMRIIGLEYSKLSRYHLGTGNTYSGRLTWQMMQFDFIHLQKIFDPLRGYMFPLWHCVNYWWLASCFGRFFGSWCRYELFVSQVWNDCIAVRLFESKPDLISDCCITVDAGSAEILALPIETFFANNNIAKLCQFMKVSCTLFVKRLVSSFNVEIEV